MDLRLLDAEPTAAERDAVDAFLGPSLATWSGTDAIENGHAAHGGHAARAQRHMLLPTLHALHERAGWISPGGLNYVAQRLTVPPADVYGVATFYALFSTEERPPRVVHVCDDVACRCAGSEELIAELKERFGPEDTDVDGASWLRSPCLGQCDRAPAALLTEAGDDAARARADARRRRRAHRRSSAARTPPAPPSTTPPQQGDPSAAAAAPRRPGRSREPRRLPRPRRLRRAAARDRARPRGRDPRGHRLEPRRARRRRVPDGPQVGRRRAPAAAPALPDLQRRRVRAGHVQGPRAHGGRPVRRDRGDDDRRATRPAASTATSTCAASTRSRQHRIEHAIDEARERGFLGADVLGARLRASTSRCARAPARTSAARRPRSSARSRATAASRATSRRSRSSRACSGSRRWSTTSRRSSTCWRSCSRAGRRSPQIGTEKSTGPKLFCVSGAVERPGHLRGAVRHDAARAVRARRRRARRTCRPCCSAARPACSSRPTSSTCALTFEDARGSGVTLGSGVVLAIDDSMDLGRC